MTTPAQVPEAVLFTTQTKRYYFPNTERKTESVKDQSDPKQPRFTREETAAINELKKRDREVRTHEQAHLAAAGQYATSGASFTYQKGPDGKSYATGGEVNIDTSSIPGDPQATIRKAEQVRRAAMAPASPSAQDRSVAAQAASMAIKAQIELSRQQQEKTGSDPARAESPDKTETVNQITANLARTYSS